MSASLYAAVEKLESSGVPVFPSAARAIKALSVVCGYKTAGDGAT